MSARRPTQYWLAIASAEHVARGVAGGFMQVCHGKRGPLMRIHPGDIVVYYSPTHTFGGKDKCQAFTAIGTARDHPPYPFQMHADFCPFRRDVAWLPAQAASILPLLDQLSWSRHNKNWGYPLRFGLIPLTQADIQHIATAMQASLPPNP